MTTLLRRAGHSAAPLAWALSVWGAARVPWLSDPLPVLGLLRGPLGLGLIAVGLALSISRRVGRWRPRVVRAEVLFGIAAVIYLATGIFYANRLQAAGDEPHYLIIAQSLWQDGDLDLRGNYYSKDYLAYNPGPIEPHYGSPRKDGTPFPAHSPGLPAMLAPVYALGGRAACVVLLALLGAWLTAEVYRVALALTNDADAALVAWAASLGPPIYFYSFHVYTEVPSALVIVLALRLSVAARRWERGVLLAGLISILPWLHVKMIPAALILGIVCLARLRRPASLGFVAAALVMGAVFLGYYQMLFGRPTPLAIYGGVPGDMTGRPIAAMLGLLLDRSYGLLPHAPVFLLALASLPALVRERRFAYLAVALAVVAPLLAWRMWWGGMCPPARFLVPILPLMAIAVAHRVAASGRGLARWRWPLVGVGLALGIYMIHNPVDRLLLNQRDRPTRVWTWLAGDVDLGHYLPSLVARDDVELRISMVWLAALVVLIGLDRLAQDRDRVDRVFRGMALPVLLLISVGVAVDWARQGAGAEVRALSGPALDPLNEAVFVEALQLERYAARAALQHTVVPDQHPEPVSTIVVRGDHSQGEWLPA